MKLDSLAKTLSIAKDVVVVLAVIFLGWRYLPLVVDPSLTSDFEIAEINLLVVKLQPAPSERAIPASATELSTGEPPTTGAEHPDETTPAADGDVVFYAQQSQGRGAPVAVVVPEKNVARGDSGQSGSAVVPGWSYLGTHRDGQYSDLNFKVDSDIDPPDLKGMQIEATTDVFVRDDRPRFLIGWQMGDRVGVVKQGRQVQVAEVALIPARGGGSRVWVRVE